MVHKEVTRIVMQSELGGISRLVFPIVEFHRLIERL